MDVDQAGPGPERPDAPYTGPFKNWTRMIFIVMLFVMAIIVASILTIYVSTTIGTFFLVLAGCLNLFVPSIYELMSRSHSHSSASLFDRGDQFLDNAWHGWLHPSRGISATSMRLLTVVFLLLALIVGGIISPSAPQWLHNKIVPLPQPSATPAPHGIYVDPKTAIGISDGQYRFWSGSDTNNAEALIYADNRNILNSHAHYVTMVVATSLVPDSSGIVRGRVDLQAAYVLQHQANQMDGCPYSDSTGCVRVRLLVANAGLNMEYGSTIANQIVQIAQQDPTLIGVIAWPLSTPGSIDAMRILAAHKIVVISSTASSDALTAISPYFFRVAPIDSQQGPVDAQFAERNFPNAHNALVLYTPGNPYSLTLATSFAQTFLEKSGNNVLLKTYDINSPDNQKDYAIQQALTDAFNASHPPDLMFFAGYSGDFRKLVNIFRSNFAEHSNLPIISGDAYTTGAFPSSIYQSLYFTDFASPDEWGTYQNPCQLSASVPLVVRKFFCDYKNDFDPQYQHPGQYGYSRPDSDVIMAYDSALVLMKGYMTSYQATKKLHPTMDDIQQAIQGFNRCHPLQGVSGEIAFAPDNNPLNKAIVLIQVDSQGHTIFLSVPANALRASSAQEC